MGGASKLLMLLSTPFPRPVTFRLGRHAKLGLSSLQHRDIYHQSTLSSPLTRPRSSRLAIHTQTAPDRDDNGRPQPFESVPVGGGGGGYAWPEWVRLLEYVREGRFGNGSIMDGVDGGDDSFSGTERLPENFIKEAMGCLALARSRPELFRLLSKKDIEVVVKNGSPFLFKNAMNSSRRMRLFLDGQEGSVLNNEKPETVDLMRYLLGYVYNYVSSWENSSSGTKLVEASVRNLFSQLISANGTSQQSNFTESYNNDPTSFEQSSQHFRQNLEMKRGDWVCPKCTFMNFARNMKCLECEEARPKQQLTGGEWECPQCDFFNYGRNLTCLRCDCKRPEGTLSSTPSSGFRHSTSPNFEEVYVGSNKNKSEIERRLAENDEKAEKWFSKVSQLGDTSDLSSVIADEDFPEIMPLRKGVNRFVVSTRKTPLERRLANDQYKRNSVDGTTHGNETRIETESSFSKTLDRILGQSSVSQGKNNTSSSVLGNSSSTARRDPSSVPFVPLPTDMFRKPQAEGQQQPQITISTSNNGHSSGTPESIQSVEVSISEGSDNLTGSKREDLGTSNSEDDFPDIMPIRKGENRFVISKKKDRSLTSPQYKRRLAMEQANNSSFVPFVPFPPGYFAKKETQSEFGNSTTKTESESDASAMSEKVPTGIDNSSETKASSISLNDRSQQIVDGVVSQQFEKKWDDNKVNLDPEKGNSPTSWGSSSWNKGPFQENDSGRMNESGNFNPTSWNNNGGSWDGRSPSHGSNLSAVSTAGNSSPSWNSNNASWKSESTRGGNYGNETSSLPSWNNNGGEQNNRPSPRSNTYATRSSDNTNQATTNNQTAKQSWGGGFSGKSLEGSAVTEPDPLDMSEEAKAQRWFRRVAQIKDISELSNIPDEDFPEIMPMRKGVNRFVVSKRKTPLERRLTSPQYRRNLPIVRSEPEKDSNQSNS